MQFIAGKRLFADIGAADNAFIKSVDHQRVIAPAFANHPETDVVQRERHVLHRHQLFIKDATPAIKQLFHAVLAVFNQFLKEGDVMKIEPIGDLLGIGKMREGGIIRDRLKAYPDTRQHLLRLLLLERLKPDAVAFISGVDVALRFHAGAERPFDIRRAAPV